MADSVLSAIADGRPGAVDECIRRYGRLVSSLARRSSVDAQDAEDAVQEIWIALWRSAARFDPNIASETTFVSTVAKRRLIDRARRRRRRPEGELLEDVAAAGAASAAELADEAARVRAALARLRREQRQVLESNLVQGRTHLEIATETGMPLGTVKSHARRGLQRVREMLGIEPDPHPGDGIRRSHSVRATRAAGGDRAEDSDDG